MSEKYSRLRSANLKLHPGKCSFAHSQIHYLISPNPAKVSAVSTYPSPTCLKDLRSYLGLTGYYRKFIKKYAGIAAPLYELTKKDVPFEWTESCETAFNELKSLLIFAPILGFPVANSPYILYTDASSFSIGAVHIQEDGVERAISYIGRSLSSAERNYGITEKECLALVFAVKKLDSYLRYNTFTAVVDHAALQWLLRLKEPVGKFARWIAILTSYTYDIVYRPGQLHSNADGVSRRQYESSQSNEESALEVLPDYVISESGPVSNQPESTVPVKSLKLQKISSLHSDSSQLSTDLSSLWNSENLIELQQKDEWYKDIVVYLRDNVLPKEESKKKEVLSFYSDYFISNDILYHVFATKGKGHRENRLTVQIAVPKLLVETVLKHFHDEPLSGGHFGIHRTLAKAKIKFHWP